MKRPLALLALIATLGTMTYALAYKWDTKDLTQNGKIRPAVVAGTFYPENPDILRRLVDGYLEVAQPEKLDGPLFALLAPHAGYPFSGRIAAHAFALLKGRKYERVVIIAPSHTESFSHASIYDGDAYTTPLGQVPIDKTFASKLAEKSPLIKLSDAGHRSLLGRHEHAIEVELPFLQRTLGNFKLVPIIMGDQNYDLERALGLALAESIDPQNPDTLIVVSSDLSHFHAYDQAEKLDHMLLNAVAENDYFSLSKNLEQRVWEACGGGPIIAAMIAAERLGATRNVILNYANSGDVIADKSRVVGYGTAAFTRENAPPPSSPQKFSFSPEEKEILLSVAKKSVDAAVRQEKLYELPQSLPKSLSIPRGTFVTLKKNGALRGCIGYTTPAKPLAEAVRDVAALAALKDSRFSPVTPDELTALSYEISVLSPMRYVKDIEEIHIGTDGLLIKKGAKEGLLLPQVPIEQGWDRPTFLRQIGIKAGLTASGWQNRDADLFAFTAVVFGDH